MYLEWMIKNIFPANKKDSAESFLQFALILHKLTSVHISDLCPELHQSKLSGFEL